MNVLFLVECGSSVKIIYLPSLFLGQEVYSQLIVSSFWQSLLKIITISSLFIQKLWAYIWTVSVSSTSCSSKQFLLVLVRVPPPHVREQGPQLDQSGQIRLSLVLTSDTNDFSHFNTKLKNILSPWKLKIFFRVIVFPSSGSMYFPVQVRWLILSQSTFFNKQCVKFCCLFHVLSLTLTVILEVVTILGSFEFGIYFSVLVFSFQPMFPGSQVRIISKLIMMNTKIS